MESEFKIEELINQLDPKKDKCEICGKYVRIKNLVGSKYSWIAPLFNSICWHCWNEEKKNYEKQ